MAARVSTLAAGASLPLAPGRVEVEVRAGAGTLDGLRAYVVGPDGAELDPRLIHVPRSGLLIFLTEPGPCSVVVVPTQGSGLPRASLSAVVTITRPDGSADAVHTPQVEVSGLPAATLVSIEVQNSAQWTVAAPVTMTTGEDDSAPLRAAARAAARSIVGGAKVGDDLKRAIIVVLDGSASMTIPYDCGQLEALLDVVDGINDVVGTNETTALFVAGESVLPVDGDRQGGLASAFTRATSGFTVGSCLAALRARTIGSRSQIVLVTDDMPPDLDTADLAGSHTWTLVVLGGSMAATVPWLTVTEALGEASLVARRGVDPTRSLTVVDLPGRTATQMTAAAGYEPTMISLVSALGPAESLARR